MTALRQEIGVNEYAPVTSDAVFLAKTLEAVKSCSGLIHGQLENGGGVCAIGALAVALQWEGSEICVEPEILERLQAINDSMPKASPAERRLAVIAWIEKKLEMLTR
jgi:hypothetical protein